MFAKPAPPADEMPEPPDHVATLRGLRLINELEYQEWYISELLGNLQKTGFLFKHSIADGWGAWPQAYLQLCITIAKVKMEVLKLQKYRADMGGGVQDKRTTAQKERDAKAASGMISFMKHLENRKAR